ncbi:lymphocyte function-associated antigen 3 isoform 2-T2 [Porphyrio hochstetteri]
MRLLAWLMVCMRLQVYVHCEEVFAIEGENFTFPVKIDQKITDIIWTKDKDKVAEWEGEGDPTYFPSLRNRVFLDKNTGALTIFNLEFSNNGTYVLDTVQKNYDRTFQLTVLAPPSEPKISCNSSDDGLVLKCTADFEKPLYYTWNFSSRAPVHSQKAVIPDTDIDASEKATCFIKVSQTEKSSEISLSQCFPDKARFGTQKRTRAALIVSLIFCGVTVILIGFYLKGKLKGLTRKAVWNWIVCGSDKESNKEDGAPEDRQIVNNDANHEDASKEENSSLLAKPADNHGVNEQEVTQDVEARST